ncbi:MAG: hypothetical protein CVV27_01335 [Candidatus Melainabacteria bacterium HGW-Melainabacteria-1]|nr:MAG: hypothetical protein CVV27_01335 [Candidatus Melainabacteria bacterium HGW-Melainabacteria-1]
MAFVIYKHMKRVILLASLLLIACGPSPKNVNDAIGRGRIDQGVRLLAELLNQNGEISSKRLEQVLKALRDSRKFTLEQADELVDRLKPEPRKAVLPWYVDTYLRVAEAAIQREQFDAARKVWLRHQKVRAHAYPDFRETIPVLGIIDLREADYWLSKGNKPKARQLLAAAEKKLSSKRPFDLVGPYAFQNLAKDLQRRLK